MLTIRNSRDLVYSLFGICVLLGFANPVVAAPHCAPGASFQLSSPYTLATPGNSYIYGIAAGDLNRDGRTDLVAASNLSSDGGLLVFYADGPRSFAPHIAIASMTPRFEDVALIDINRDGRLDILAITETGDLYKFTNTLAGFEQAHTSIIVPRGEEGRYHLEVARMNASDNVPDLVASGRGYAQILYGFFDGFSPGNIFIMAGHAQTGDFNGDGKLDLVSVGDGGYGPRASMRLSSEQGYEEAFAPVSDGGRGFTVAPRLNNDLRSDLYVIDSNTQTITSYQQGPASTFEPLRTTARPDFFSRIAASGDLDADGYSDLAIDGYDGDFTLLLRRESAVREYEVPMYVSYELLITDLDRDGRNDVVIGGLPSETDRSISILYNSTPCMPMSLATALRVCEHGMC